MRKFNPWITKNQLRRAGYLIGALDTLQADTETRLRFAEGLELADWQDKVGALADHLCDTAGDTHPRFRDRPPSAETVAIAIGMLDSRYINEQMAS